MFLFLIILFVMLTWNLLVLRMLSGLRKKISIQKDENVSEVYISQVRKTPDSTEEEAKVEDVITTNKKECPFCCEEIKAAASRCPYCGESLGQHLHSPLGRPLRWHEFKQKRSSSYLKWTFYSWEWIFESTVLHIKKLAFFEILDYVSRASVLIAVIFWFLQSGERERQAQIQAWQLISFEEQIGGGVATVQALELLNCTDSFWWCNQVSFQGIKLENTNLPQLNFPNAILIEASLKGADLSNADLSNANLWLATLLNADLSNADLSNANLSDADLTNAFLRNADLTNATLSNADLTNAFLLNANLTDAFLWNATLLNADLSDADLSNADLSDADLTNATLLNADLRDADLTNATLLNADLLGANLREVRYNTATRWPLGFDPTPSGAILTE